MKTISGQEYIQQTHTHFLSVAAHYYADLTLNISQKAQAVASFIHDGNFTHARDFVIQDVDCQVCLLRHYAAIELMYVTLKERIALVERVRAAFIKHFPDLDRETSHMYAITVMRSADQIGISPQDYDTALSNDVINFQSFGPADPSTVDPETGFPLPPKTARH
jgi:hypothetical protein